MLDIEYIYLLIYRFLTETDFVSLVVSLWQSWIPFSIVLSMLLLAGTVYAVVRHGQVYAEWKKAIAEKQKTLEERERELASGADGLAAWRQVTEHIGSESEGNWRLAILEADIMLDRLIERMGYPGENLGERLRGIKQADMRSIDAAWEAHKVRNRIAHDGAAYPMSQREARRVVDLYRQVFEELNYI